MPEGDTIYRTARALQKALAERVVTDFETGVAKLASVNDDKPVIGRTVERVEARGKWCLIFFSGDLILVSHMLMSGSWHIYRTGEKWFLPRSKMRVAITVGSPGLPQGLNPSDLLVEENGTAEAMPLRGASTGLRPEPGFEGGHPANPHLKSEMRGNQTSIQIGGGFQAVLFNAQIAEFHTARSLERSSQVPKLGPDILAGEFTIEHGIAALSERAASYPDDEIAVVLLNQRVMAGLGNVYKSEVAFAAGVNPFRAMRTLTQGEMETMVEVSQRYMKANVNEGAGDGIVTYSGNRRTTNAMDKGDRLWVYGRQGQECRRCGAAIEMRKQGEAVRSTYWCPVCQPWIAADGQSAVAPKGNAVKLQGARRRVGC
jgi:endonuclease-8